MQNYYGSYNDRNKLSTHPPDDSLLIFLTFVGKDLYASL